MDSAKTLLFIALCTTLFCEVRTSLFFSFVTRTPIKGCKCSYFTQTVFLCPQTQQSLYPCCVHMHMRKHRVKIKHGLCIEYSLLYYMRTCAFLVHVLILHVLYRDIEILIVECVDHLASSVKRSSTAACTNRIAISPSIQKLTSWFGCICHLAQEKCTTILIDNGWTPPPPPPSLTLPLPPQLNPSI